MSDSNKLDEEKKKIEAKKKAAEESLSKNEKDIEADNKKLQELDEKEKNLEEQRKDATDEVKKEIDKKLDDIKKEKEGVSKNIENLKSEKEKNQEVVFDSSVELVLNKEKQAEHEAEEAKKLGSFEQKVGTSLEISVGNSHEIKVGFSNELSVSGGLDTKIGMSQKFDFGPEIKFSGLPFGHDWATQEVSFHNSSESKFNVSDHGDDKYTNFTSVYTKEGFSAYAGYDNTLIGESAELTYEAYQESIKKTAQGLFLLHMIANITPLLVGIEKHADLKVHSLGGALAGAASAIDYWVINRLIDDKKNFKKHFVPKSVIFNHGDHGVYLGAVSNGGAKPNGRQGSELYLNNEFRVQVSDDVDAYDIDREHNARQPKLNADVIPTRLILDPKVFKVSAKDCLEMRLNDNETLYLAAKDARDQAREDVDSMKKSLQSTNDQINELNGIKDTLPPVQVIQYIAANIDPLNTTKLMREAELARLNGILAAKEAEVVLAKANVETGNIGYIKIHSDNNEKQILGEAQTISLKATNDKVLSTSLRLGASEFNVGLPAADMGIKMNVKDAGGGAGDVLLSRSANQKILMDATGVSMSFDNNNQIAVTKNKITFKLNGKTIDFTDANVGVNGNLKILP